MSLTAGRIGLLTATVWEATCVPSTKYVTPLDVQLMRNRCGLPSRPAASWVSVLPPGPAVRAYSAPPELVLNIAHREVLKSSANPTCWNAAPVNVATNSSDRPGAYRVVVRANAASTVSSPPETVAAPPAFQAELVQSGVRAVPENSEPAAGLRLTSPSAVWVTAVPASVVPAPKSAAVVSVRLRYGCVVNDQVMSDPTGVPSEPVTLPEIVTW